jgi:formylglycine-generating enzyme required for sulfatase activity
MMLRSTGLLGIACLSILASPLIGAELPAGRVHTNSLGIRLVRIEAGRFAMGAGAVGPTTREEWLQRDEDEAPVHAVTISRSFFLGAFEVTNAQYEQFDSSHKKFRGANADDEPVTNVTWRQAVEFCDWLSKKEVQPYRLPTEAEWEYACRAGTTTPYHTGESLSAEQANFGVGPDGKTKIGVRRVGSYPPNAWGLYDMHGNVAEWCLDWHGPYASGDQTDPVGRIDGHARVVRGWSHLGAGFQKAERFCRSSNRSGHLPEDANRFTGFRIVLGELPATKPFPIAEPPLHQRNVKQTPAPKIDRDPNKPIFIDYSAKKAGPTIAPQTWGPIFSSHNHFSSVCVCPNGDVLAVWYTCVGEGDRQLAQAASRLRAGSDLWEPASFFFGTPDVNTHAPVLLRDGSRIYHFCTQSLRGWDSATNIVRFSDDSGATWSKPILMLSRDDPNHLSQPCSAFVAKDGTLVLACDGDGHKDERLMLSKDKGKTWTVAKGDMRRTVGKYAIHPAVAQRADGAIVSFLRGPDPMPLLISRDWGDSWTAHASPFPGIGVGQKAIALRLASGGLALLTADRTKRLGGNTILALSLDGGATWPHVRKVEAPVGGYMSMAQDDDGMIYLIGSRMNFAVCNEAWLHEGKAWAAAGPEGPAPKTLAEDGRLERCVPLTTSTLSTLPDGFIAVPEAE